jgi:hypothetical protein
MPIQDDPSVPDDAIVIRVLLDSWLTTKGGRVRPASWALLDMGGDGECSCFLASESIVNKLSNHFAGKHIAQIPASVLRANSFAIQRKPDECPEGLRDDNGCHVVIGPRDVCTSHQVEQRARRIVRDVSVRVTKLETIALPPDAALGA